ncbi:MAG: N-acetylmuramoyl-L-alanine amidase [Nitrospirota bacterium]|nr:N-acetylmuramoyl-L-alanine amidase [Nitrospirota bacterium]
MLTLFFACYAHGADHTVVEGVRYSSYKSYTRIVVDLNGPADFSQHRIAGPDRIFFDLKNCSLSEKAKPSVSVDDGVLKKVRIAQYEENTVRVVFDLPDKKKFYAFTLEKPYRLVIDIYAQKSDDASQQITKKQNTLPDNPYAVKTVVIDAGHGGRDPGAVGPGGLMEKDITLYVGKKLGDILEKQNNMKVIYTRTQDKFIPLDERTGIANSQKADLFISVHTNANNERKVRGIETYFMNWTNDKEALKVAARENSISLKKMLKARDGLQVILQDLARKNKNEESMKLAHSVQNSIVNTLRKDYQRVEDLGVKFAFFYVLVGAEMPSILVEISFISNSEEEKRLAEEGYKNTVAEAIAKGVDSYVKQSTLMVKKSGEVL